MKKFLSLIITVVFALGLKAQTTLTEAPDFIAPDYFGDEIHLYEILENDQYVLLHINTRTNEATPTVTPPLVEAYKRLGCNQHDVFFIGVVPNGTTNITKKYVDEYGIEFPMIHNTDESNGMQGPAMDIWRAHNCNQPTTMLIAPNKSIVLQDIGDIKTSDDVVSALAPFSIKEYDCGDDNTGDDNTGDDNTGDDNTSDDNTGDDNTGDDNTGDDNTGDDNTGDDNTGDDNTGDDNTGDDNTGDDNTGDDNTGDDNTGDDNTGDDNTGDDNTGDEPQVSDSVSVEIGVVEVTPFTIEASFTPNDECASYFILCDSVGSMEQWTNMFGFTLEQLIEQWSLARTEPSTHLWENLIPDTEYIIYVLPKDAEGNAGKLQTLSVNTLAIGGEGVSVIDIQVEVVTTTSVRVIATPNEETAEYHYMLFTKSFSDSIGVDSTMKFLYEDHYALYEVDNWLWEELLPNTEYYAIAQGKNIKGEWGEITKVEFVTTKPDAIEELSSSFKLYPNPASTEIKITSKHNGEADVKIYDMTGRCVKDVYISNINNATINISDIDKGLYLININGSFEKLIIE